MMRTVARALRPAPVSLRLSLGLTLGLVGCGVSTAEYDARTAELRAATDRLASCSDNASRAEADATATKGDLEEIRARARELESERKEIGIHTAAGKEGLRQALADRARAAAAAEERSRFREQLAQHLAEEAKTPFAFTEPQPEGPARQRTLPSLAIEDRDGAVRVVFPEARLFARNSTDMTSDGRKILDAVARELRLLPSRRLLVSAHSDDVPNKSYTGGNLGLTVDRARRVAQYLIKQGLDGDYLAASGLGDTEPVADNATDDGRLANRRIEVRILGPAPAHRVTTTAIAKKASDKTADPASDKASEKAADKAASKAADKPAASAPPPPPAPINATDDPGL